MIDLYDNYRVYSYDLDFLYNLFID